MKKRILFILAASLAGAITGFVVAAGLNLATWGASQWSALAAWVTALIALTAGGVAWNQLREARRLRVEQAQPYVVTYMEPSLVNPQFVDLVLRNFGVTAAVDVRLVVDPVLRRSTGNGDSTEDVWIPDMLPLLVPGQDWRTMWDYSVDRRDTGLPDRYEAVVFYRDTRGTEFSSPAVFDWGAFKGRQWATTYGIHDAAKALRELQKTVRKWQESIHGGLAVYVRDGDAKDEANKEALRRAQAQHDDVRSKLLPGNEITDS